MYIFFQAVIFARLHKAVRVWFCGRFQLARVVVLFFIALRAYTRASHNRQCELARTTHTKGVGFRLFLFCYFSPIPVLFRRPPLLVMQQFACVGEKLRHLKRSTVFVCLLSM